MPVTSLSFLWCVFLDGAPYLSMRSLLSLLSLLLLPILLSRPSRCGRCEDSRLRGRSRIVWESHGVGVAVVVDLWSLTETDRTILLSFSIQTTHISRRPNSGAPAIILPLLTDIQYISSSACVQSQRGVTCRTVLRIEFLDVLVKTCFVGDVSA